MHLLFSLIIAAVIITTRPEAASGGEAASYTSFCIRQTTEVIDSCPSEINEKKMGNRSGVGVCQAHFLTFRPSCSRACVTCGYFGNFSTIPLGDGPKTKDL